MASTSKTPQQIEQEIEKAKKAINISNYKQITDKKAYYTRWVFTWNNYLEQDERKLDIFAHKYCKYLIYGRETAPTTGTKHLQGYIHLLKRFTFNQMKNFLGDQISLFVAYKTDLANYRYCSKSGDFYYYETSLFGSQTESSTNNNVKSKKLTTKERIDIAWDLAKNEKFEEIDRDILLKHGKQLKAIKMEYYSNIEENLYYDQGDKNYFHCHNLWLWGETGTGKSFFITYFIDGINRWWKRRCLRLNQPYFPLRIFNHQKTKWWCGYMGEEIIVINEVNPTFCSWYANEIKEWVDQYPFNAEVKGSNIGKIRPQFFIFTSNYNLDECFCEMRGRDVLKDEITGKPKLLTEDIKAMHRRMKVIKRTKEDKNKLVRWPCFKQLDDYLDNFEDYKIKMQTIKDNYDNEVVKYNNTSNIIIIDETEKTIKKSTKKDKGKQPAESPKKRKANSQPSSSKSTPKNKKLKKKSPKKPSKPEVGICEKCQKAKIKNYITNIWLCELCEKDPLSCTCSPMSELKNKNPLFNNLNYDSIIEINYSFIDNINSDKVITSTQNNSKSIIQDDIEEIPSSPLKEKSLQRQNAFIYDSQNKQYIGEAPSTSDFCSTPNSEHYNSDDDFMPDNRKTKPQEESTDYEELNIDMDELKKIEKDIEILKEESNKNEQDLADDQETYANIPQFDGTDDSLIDEYGNVFKSEKQKYFINKKIQLILKYNEYIRKIKIAFDKHKINEITFIRQLKKYETDKQKIINEFELFKYHYPENCDYKGLDLCYYCKSGVINSCSCTGEYIYNIPAETFEEKLLWIEHRKQIDQLNKLNIALTTTFKEIIELDDCIFNIWKYKYRIDDMRKEKCDLLAKFPFIKKYDTLGKHYNDKLCYYCNFGVKKFCECSGKFIYTDQQGQKWDESEDHTDDAYDQWHEQDRPDYQY